MLNHRIRKLENENRENKIRLRNIETTNNAKNITKIEGRTSMSNACIHVAHVAQQQHQQHDREWTENEHRTKSINNNNNNLTENEQKLGASKDYHEASKGSSGPKPLKVL